jgi:acetolactate synthase-1/2/3 large subunit
VRQWQEMFHQSNYSHVDLEASPDFMKLAEAYGAHAIRCFTTSGVQAALDEAMTITDRPTVLDFRISKETNVFPMIKSGGTIHDMIVQRPPNLVPLDSYIASETYMPEVEEGSVKEEEKTPAYVGERLG